MPLAVRERVLMALFHIFMYDGAIRSNAPAIADSGRRGSGRELSNCEGELYYISEGS